MMDDIPVPITEAYGKKWIIMPATLVLQCAYCLYLQQLDPIRDDMGLVVRLRLNLKDESHRDDCPQANKPKE